MSIQDAIKNVLKTPGGLRGKSLWKCMNTITIRSINWCANTIGLICGAGACILTALPIALVAAAPSDLEQFRKLLEQPEWVEKTVFLRSGNYEMKSFYDGKTEKTAILEGYTKYEASLQPDGFYLKHLTNSPYGKNKVVRGKMTGPEPGPEKNVVHGASLEDFWSISRGRLNMAISPRVPPDVPPQYPFRDPMARIVGGRSLDKVLCIQRLGIEHLTRDPLRWINDLDFVIHGDNNHRVEGKISKVEDGRPSEITYSYYTPDGKQTFKLQYKYGGSQAALPMEFVRTEIGAKASKHRYTNVIKQITFGVTASVAGKGFKPADFLNADDEIENYITYTNGLPTYHYTDGRVVVPPRTEADAEPRVDWGAAEKRSARLRLIAMGVIGLSLIAWLVMGKLSPKRKLTSK